jgi:drug/metabolite transporter (DMT)-like permease
MNSRRTSGPLLLLAAAIWGFAFVAQRAGMAHVGPFTFNAVRFALGGLVLLPLIALRGRRSPVSPAAQLPAAGRWIWWGTAAGLVLFAGASLQQTGIVFTTAGKAGFITGLYVIIVPLGGLLWRQRTAAPAWLGAVLAVAGLYFLSLSGGLRMVRGDLLVLAGAFFWAGHVQLIGWLSPRTDPIRLACLQFFACAAASLLAAVFVEPAFFQRMTAPGLRAAAWPILYAGLLSTGVAYTLQVVAQRRAPPAHAAIILSLEAVFAALGGWFLLKEVLSRRELFGCLLMLAGMLLSQIRPSGKGENHAAGECLRSDGRR